MSSRSDKLKFIVVEGSLQTVDVSVGAASLFQKKGLRRLAGLVIFGLTNLKALGGGGGPGGGGGGGIPLDEYPLQKRSVC